MANKVVITVASFVLLIGVVIGVVAVVHVGDKSKNANVSSSTKAVTSICATTDFKDACMNSLGSVANNESATVKDYIATAIRATIEESKKASSMVETVKVDNGTDPREHMAVEDCKELLEYAVQDLQASLSMVGDSELHTLNDRVFELLNWFTGVVSYQQSCLDQLEVPQYRTPIENGLVNSTQLTSNAINIVAQLRDILPAFNINIDDLNTTAITSRRLLQATEVGSDGFPAWFSDSSDRRLLRGMKIPANAVVAKDGSGQYKTIAEAVKAIPEKRQGRRWVIYVKAGIYRESVLIDKKFPNVFMYGDGPRKTVVTGSKNYGIDNIPTQDTATFSVLGDGFIARGMGFHNTAGPKGHQAVAFRSQSDRSALFNCRFEGYQDTLYYQAHRQFYRNCVIKGTIDFIFGRGTALIQNSQIIVRMPAGDINTVTADGNNEERAIGGLVLQNCRIVPEALLFPNRFKVRTYLGRPWDKSSVTAVMESELGDLIRPEGWSVWEGKSNHESCTVVEYRNRGPGANTSRRVHWNHFVALTDRNKALIYTVPIFLENVPKRHRWVARTGVPANFGLAP